MLGLVYGPVLCTAQACNAGSSNAQLCVMSGSVDCSGLNKPGLCMSGLDWCYGQACLSPWEERISWSAPSPFCCLHLSDPAVTCCSRGRRQGAISSFPYAVSSHVGGRARESWRAGDTPGCGPLSSSQHQSLRLSHVKEEGSTEVLIPILSYHLLIPLNV